jgi:signal peptide peptidase SppA
MTTSNMVMALQKLSGREMLINTESADEFVANLTRFAGTDTAEISALEVASREQLCMAFGFEDAQGDDRKPFVYHDGLAIIPVHGSLINRFGSSWGFVTGYNFIRRQMNAALDDEDVQQIVFDVNSPGGEASGCFELAREIIASRRVKPSLAFVDSLAASGGMAIAGSATKMYGIPSGRVGSIGVYRQHVSVKGALDQQGIEITFASAVDHKLDGSPYEKLPASVLKDWTEDANRTWDDFIALVADGRGMDPAAVRETQARIYRSDEALALGLIDGVWTTTEAIPAFLAELDDTNPDAEEEDDMDAKTKTGSEATSAAVDYDKIASMIGTAVGGAISNLTRSQNIAAHGKDKGQVALASKLAANPAITEADAISMIDDAAAAAAPAPKAKKTTKVSSVTDGGEDDDDDDGEGDEDDANDDGEGDEDGDEVAAARTRRQKAKSNGKSNRVDQVNHLDGAMSQSGGGSGVGGGSGNSGNAAKGDAADTNQLLADYAQHTGTVLGKKAKA